MGRPKMTFFQKVFSKVPIVKNFIRYNIKYLTDEDRAKSLELRQKRADLKLLELQLQEMDLKKQLAQMQGVTPEEKMQQVINQVIDNIVQNGFNKGLNNVPKPPKPKQELKPLPKYEEIDEEEIRAKLNDIHPSAKAYLKSRSDEELRFMAHKELGISGANVEKAIQILRSE